MLTALLFLVVLSVLVIAHEFGHYIVARMCGVTVEEFGLGFPPRIAAWKGKRGMLWSLNAIPLGGFVRLKGESGDDRTAPDSFGRQSIPKRFAVLVAGVAMNLVAAAVIFTVGFMVGMPTVTEGGVDGGTVTNASVRVLEVVAGSPAETSGFAVGDRLLTIDGAAFATSADARAALGTDVVHTVVVQRDGVDTTMTVDPEYMESLGKVGVGVGLVETGDVRFPWYKAPIMGVSAMVSSTVQVVSAFAALIASPFTHTTVEAEVAGPVGIAVLTGEVARLGFAHLLQFAAMLSINLAVINVLPIPALDGGRVAFLVLELIRRKPTTPRVEQIVHGTGFAILLILVVIVTLKDIVGLFS